MFTLYYEGFENLRIAAVS